MKNIKEFFGVFLSVVICVLVVFVIVQAATTISSNVSTGNVTATGTVAVNGAGASTELAILGTASISEDLWASGSFQFGGGEGTGSLSYSRLGTGTTGHSLADADDLLISGLLEVNDVAYFDAVASMATDIWVDRIYGTLGAGYLSIGDAGTTGHSLVSEDDLLVTGNLEVDGTAYFDGVASVSDANGLMIGGGAKLFGGTASPAGATLNCAVGSWYFRAGQVASTSLYFCGTANEWDQVIGIDLGP